MDRSKDFTLDRSKKMDTKGLCLWSCVLVVRLIRAFISNKLPKMLQLGLFIILLSFLKRFDIISPYNQRWYVEVKQNPKLRFVFTKWIHSIWNFNDFWPVVDIKQQVNSSDDWSFSPAPPKPESDVQSKICHQTLLAPCYLFSIICFANIWLHPHPLHPMRALSPPPSLPHNWPGGERAGFTAPVRPTDTPTVHHKTLQVEQGRF